MMDRTAEDTSAKVPGTSTAGEPGPTQSPTPEVIRQRLTGPFTTTYLTLARQKSILVATVRGHVQRHRGAD